jgi:hypothetical protein
LSAVKIAKLEARQQQGDSKKPISMSSLKRRAFNQHLLDRIVAHLAHGQSLKKSSPDYEVLCTQNRHPNIRKRVKSNPKEANAT